MTPTRTALLALALLAPTPAFAQDATPASEPAGLAVAKAIKKLRAAKQDFARLTRTRHYVMRRRGEVILFVLEGTITQPMDGPPNPWRFDLVLKARRFSRPGRIEFSYQVGTDGMLSRIGLQEVREPKGKPSKTRGVQGTIENGQLSAKRVEDGQAGPGFTLPWSDNTLPAIFAWFVVPSLFDQGLPASLNPDLLLEEKLRPNRKLETASYKRTSKVPFKNKAGVLIHTFETTGKHDTTKIAVAADGADKGLVLQVKVGKTRTFDYITPKAHAQLLKDAPLIANEAKAQKVLRSLHYAQDSHKRSKARFAASLDPLEAQDTYLAQRIQELQPAYLILIRAAPDGSSWMAIAVPAEPGKTGKRYFVTNAEGKVFASPTKLELDDSCAIPKGAKLVK